MAKRLLVMAALLLGCGGGKHAHDEPKKDAATSPEHELGGCFYQEPPDTYETCLVGAYNGEDMTHSLCTRLGARFVATSCPLSGVIANCRGDENNPVRLLYDAGHKDEFAAKCQALDRKLVLSQVE